MNLARVLSTAVAILVSVNSFGAPLDPNAFPSLGVLNVTSGSLTINTNNLSITGAAGFSGISRPQDGASQIAIFTFDSINVGPSVPVTIVGDRPLALLSKGTATVLASLNVSATITGAPGETRPGPGGYAGGLAYGFSNASWNSSAGSGPGGGPSYASFSLGGSFGGGGYIQSGPTYVATVAPYGDLLSTLQGGSGGAAAELSIGAVASGGGGGGAIEIGAVGNLVVGPITANGSVANANGGFFSAGGGGGGGILLHSGGTLTTTSGLAARGGAPSNNAGIASGGGGGRIALLGLPTFTLGTTPVSVDLTGGSFSGFAGVLTVEAKSTTVPSGASVDLNGNPVLSTPGSFNQSSPTVEAVIERDLTINSGGTVTLGKSDPLRSGSNLTVNGAFKTGAYSQTVGSLTGSGTVMLGSGGELVVGEGNVSSTFNGSVSGAGTLTKVGSGDAIFTGSLTHTGGVDVQDGILQINGGSLTPAAQLVKTGGGALVVTSGGAIGAGHTHVREGALAYVGVSDGSGPGFSMTIDPGARLIVNNAALSRAIDGVGGASTIRSMGTSILGELGNFMGFRHEGVLEVTFGSSLTLNSRGFASLGVLTSLAGATLNAPNGISLGVGANLTGSGNVNAKIAAGFGSRIEVTSSMTSLTLGANAPNGFTSDGELYTGANTVTINDSNEAVLGSLTSLGDGSSGGSLVAGDAMSGDTHVHLLFSEGKNLVGRGNVVGNVKNNGHVIGDGTALNERIVFDAGWTVSGIGTFDNVLFNGTFAPGLSPGISTGTNQAFAGAVEIELGGLSPGAGAGNHDQIQDLGSIDLIAGSELRILPYSEFLPQVGDEFEIIQWHDRLVGTFGHVITDPWFTSRGVGFVLERGATSLSLHAVAVPEPGTLALIWALVFVTYPLSRRAARPENAE